VKSISAFSADGRPALHVRARVPDSGRNLHGPLTETRRESRSLAIVDSGAHTYICSVSVPIDHQSRMVNLPGPEASLSCVSLLLTRTLRRMPETIAICKPLHHLPHRFIMPERGFGRSPRLQGWKGKWIPSESLEVVIERLNGLKACSLTMLLVSGTHCSLGI
jgi:hypothetical protein